MGGLSYPETSPHFFVAKQCSHLQDNIDFLSGLVSVLFVLNIPYLGHWRSCMLISYIVQVWP